MATVSWIDGTGNWNTGADWSTGSPPGPGDDAAITNGGFVSLTTAITVNSITISAGSLLGIAVPGGTVSVTGDFIGNGSVGIDRTSGGGTTLNIAGTLSGGPGIGNDALNAPTMVTAGGLGAGSGATLIGNITSGTINEATLYVQAAAPTTFRTVVTIEGDALLEFAGGGISNIPTGSQLYLQGAQARIAIAGDTSGNSALTGLTSNGGLLGLDDHVTVNTSSGLAFTNSGTLDVDGGATLSLGGTLSNNGTIDVLTSGDHGDYATASGTTTINASGLVNTGSIRLWGNTPDQSQAIMDIAGPAPTTWTGSGSMLGYSLLEFASGGITSIAQGGSLYLNGPSERIALASDTTTNSSLARLSNSAGNLDLENGAVLAISAANFTNTGQLSIDVNGGSSNVSFQGLTNSSTMQVGFFTNVVATSTVIAASLSNTGTLIVEGYEYGGITVGPTMTVSGVTVNSGTIETFGVSTVDLAATISGTGTIEVGNRGCVVEFGAGVASSQKVTFLSGGPAVSLPPPTVKLDDPTEFAATIAGLNVGSSTTTPTNQLDLTNIANSSITGATLDSSSDILTVSTIGSGAFGIQLSGNYMPGTVVDHIVDSSGNGTDLFLSAAVCFCRGTLILTEQGEVPVEELAVGDLVVTVSGEVQPIQWIGFGRDEVTRGNKLARPVIVRAGALAEGVPARDLHLTHGHALFLHDVLIPVENLVNHRSIQWDDEARIVEFYHIELATHDVVLADGAPAETYYDAGNRALFSNPRPFSRIGATPPTFAPVLNGGDVVEEAWAELFARAGGVIDNDTTDDPDLHLVVDGGRLDPEVAEDGAYRFAMDAPPAAVSLRSRSGVPSLLGITRHDHRRLGVALGHITLHQAGTETVIDHDAPLLREGGCHPAEQGYSWTDGELELPARLFEHLRGAFTLTVHIERPGMRYPLAAPVPVAA